MTNDRPSELLGQLPRTRPHRRSTKRPVRGANGADSPKPAADEASTTSATEPKAAAKPTPKRARPSASKPARAREADEAKPKPARARDSEAKPKRARSATAAAQTKPASTRAKRLPQPAQPRGVPAGRRSRPPAAAGDASTRSPGAGPIVGTAVQAAAEIAEIGLALSSRALRRAVSRLPRP